MARLFPLHSGVAEEALGLEHPRLNNAMFNLLLKYKFIV